MRSVAARHVLKHSPLFVTDGHDLQPVRAHNHRVCCAVVSALKRDNGHEQAMGGQMGHSGAPVANVPEIAIRGNDTVLNPFLDPWIGVSQPSDIYGMPSARPFDFIRSARTL
jgi:hypothetical protein